MADKKIYVAIGGALTLLIGGLGIKLLQSLDDEDGYDEEGYDEEGYNQEGFNREGFNRDGYNKKGYNQEGLNRYGCREDGYTPEGYDRYGYDRHQYNADGVDRAQFTREYYSDRIKKLSNLCDKAQKELKRYEYGYAFYNARHVLEETLRLLVKHSLGPSYLRERIVDNLGVCKNEGILNESLLEALYKIKDICNDDIHNFEFAETVQHNKVHFVVMQARDLLEISKGILDVEST